VTSAASLPPSDVIFAHIACPLNDVIFLTSGKINLSPYKKVGPEKTFSLYYKHITMVNSPLEMSVSGAQIWSITLELSITILEA
jgi:hypothetical protein